jgi:hypothetical protein
MTSHVHPELWILTGEVRKSISEVKAGLKETFYSLTLLANVPIQATGENKNINYIYET